MTTSDSLPAAVKGRISAKAKGYNFGLYERTWRLEKDTTVSLGVVHKHLSGEVLDGCLKTLAYYASNLSAGHTSNNADRLQHMLSETGASAITDVVLINYRSSLTDATEWYLGTIRGFLRRWYRLGYHGVSKDTMRLLDGWKLQGNPKGDAVKRKDPVTGPLTDTELKAFNEGVVRAYEQERISLTELAMSLSMSNTGRRPRQLSHLRALDVLCGENNKGEPFYIVNVPRGKHGEGFRKEFKPFAMNHELWAVMSAQAKNAIAQVEQQLGFDLQEADRQQVPLFPALDAAAAINSLSEFRQQVPTDKLHIAAAEVTNTLKFVVGAAEIQSERTGEAVELSARRFRYTTGTRAAREGFGELVIAELLDHMDTQNAGVYVKNIPEHVERLDEAVGFQLARYAQAFAGVLVDSEENAERGGDPTSRIRTLEGQAMGTCGEHGFCGANVPIPCYTCLHFQPWLDGPHQEVYQNLLTERERVKEITGDIEVAAVLDRSIIAVADVIERCDERRAELSEQGATTDA